MGSTKNLMKMLEASPEQFLQCCTSTSANEPEFHEYLKYLMKKRKIKTCDLIKKACISKTYAYQCLNGERLFGRDIIIRLCFVLNLTVEQSNRLLTLAKKKVLYPKHRRDAIILFCLSSKMDLDKANNFIEEKDEAPLL